MSSTLDFTPILQLVHTTTQRDYMRYELSSLADHLFQNKQISVRNSLMQHMTSLYAPEMLHICDEAGIKDDDIEAVKAIVAELTTAVNELSELNLRVGFSPNEDDVKDISLWIRYHIGIQAVLNVVHDKTVVAGAIISYNGIYKNYSVSQKIEAILQDER